MRGYLCCDNSPIAAWTRIIAISAGLSGIWAGATAWVVGGILIILLRGGVILQRKRLKTLWSTKELDDKRTDIPLTFFL